LTAQILGEHFNRKNTDEITLHHQRLPSCEHRKKQLEQEVGLADDFVLLARRKTEELSKEDTYFEAILNIPRSISQREARLCREKKDNQIFTPLHKRAENYRFLSPALRPLHGVNDK